MLLFFRERKGGETPLVVSPLVSRWLTIHPFGRFERWGVSPSAEGDQGLRALGWAPPFEKGGRKLLYGACAEGGNVRKFLEGVQRKPSRKKVSFGASSRPQNKNGIAVRSRCCLIDSTEKKIICIFSYERLPTSFCALRWASHSVLSCEAR